MHLHVWHLRWGASTQIADVERWQPETLRPRRPFPRHGEKGHSWVLGGGRREGREAGVPAAPLEAAPPHRPGPAPRGAPTVGRPGGLLASRQNRCSPGVLGRARASAEQEMSDRKRYRLQAVPVGSSGTASGATPPATCVWAASASASALRGDSQAFLMLMEPGGQDFQPSSGLALPLSCRAGGDPRPDRHTVGEDSWAWPQLLIRAPARGLSTWCGQNRLVFADLPPSPWPPCCRPVSEEAVTACPPSRSETETLPLSGKRVTPLGHVL